MRVLILAAALSACATIPPPYRVPADSGAFWIWPTLAEAERWEAEHEGRLCIRRVPDGFATERC